MREILYHSIDASLVRHVLDNLLGNLLHDLISFILHTLNASKEVLPKCINSHKTVINAMILNIGKEITKKIDKEFYPKIVDHPLRSTAVLPVPLVFRIWSAFPMLPRPSWLLLTVSYGNQAGLIMPTKTSNDGAWLSWRDCAFWNNHQGPAQWKGK